MAEHFVQQMRLDSCLFVPTHVSPFKQQEEQTSAQHRLSMLRAVCRTNDRFAIDEFEIRRKQVSYTIDTLDYLRERYPDTELYLLVGTDQAQSFHQWREWERILAESHLCIARRPFINAEEEQQLVRSLSRENRPATLLQVPFIEISSRSIRTLHAEKSSIRYLVPESVRRYIRKHRLYREL